VYPRLRNLPHLVEGVLSSGRANPDYAEAQIWQEARRLVPAAAATWQPEREGANATWVANNTLLVHVPGTCREIKLMEHGISRNSYVGGLLLDNNSPSLNLVEGVGTYSE
jgi:hypothetical protein